VRRAWREGFTITLVSGRTVGIGAYLARLGRRCVQRTDQPIILTGFQALNKVLGKEVRPAAAKSCDWLRLWLQVDVV
jgi:acetyl-CoA carboxylase/biotin carboxylase 1